MRTHWVEEKIAYDGSQLSPLTNNLKHGILGDSIVSWQGACKVSLEHMMDGEDLVAKSKIEGAHMLHFVLELFNYPLSSAIVLQRLMGEILVKKMLELGKGPVREIKRKGDDLYWNKKKLNVSIATCSSTSSLIHFGVNISNEGTPVETCSLQDFSIENVAEFSQKYMDELKEEILSQKRAAVKVRSF